MFSASDIALVVAPHADDECLGVGGTIAKLVDLGASVHTAVATGHGGGESHLGPPELWDSIRDEYRAAMSILGVPPENQHLRELPAAKVADHPAWLVNDELNRLVADVRPTILFVPFPFDLHRDHREVFHALSVAWRSTSEAGRAIRLVLAYEVQSETHWNAPYLEAGFLPNVWVDIGAHLDQKLRALAAYDSQMRPFPDARSLAAVEHLARWRGSQQNLEAAEAFVLIRGRLC